MLLYSLRHAIRLLGRDRAFTTAALLTLAVGVGANVAVFAVVEAALLRPLPYADSDRVIILKHRDRRTGITKEYIAVGDHIDLAARQSRLESLSAYGTFQSTFTTSAETFRIVGLRASAGLLETLRVQPVLGRTFGADDTRPGAAPVMLLSYELWQSRFGGDAGIVGRGIQIDDEERQVVGVTPRGFAFPAYATTQVILPLILPPSAPADRTSLWVGVVGRLKAGSSLEDASAHLTALSRQLESEFPRSNQGSEYFPVSLRDALVGDTRQALILLLSAVGVVLLIACANVANLMLARSVARRQEMAVRMALGAGRGRLVVQLLTESVALSLLAGACGVALAYWAAQALVALIPASLGVAGLADVRINAGVLIFAFGLTIVTAMTFGLASALTVRSQSGIGVMAITRGATSSRSARRLTSALVVAEVALAVVLLIGAGLIVRTFTGLLAVDPGFEAADVLTMNVAISESRYKDVDARERFYDRAFESIRHIRGVEDVGVAVVVPLTGNNWTVPFERADMPIAAGERPPEVGWQLASGSYFTTLRIPLLAGRLFDPRDGPASTQVVIVSEAIQRRYFPEGNAVGRHIKLGTSTMEIIGVVGNIRRAALSDEPRADMYFPFEHSPGGSIALFVRASGNPASIARDVQASVRSVEPAAVLADVRTLDDIASESLQVTRLALWLLGLFAIVALALSAIGIYGVMSYVVRQRTRELGTRVALGATRGRILWLVMREGAAIATAGTALGLAAGLAAARSLSAILYGVSPSDPPTIAAAAFVLLSTALIACYVPARHAAAVDPARTLLD